MEGFSFDQSHATLASITQENGFATAAFLGSRVLAKQFGLANGFSVYDDEMESQTEEDSLPEFSPSGERMPVTDSALTWLKQNQQTRFFLWAHYFDPHAPYDPPEPYKQSYLKDPYSGEIAHMDEQVGRLLDGLKQMGLESSHAGGCHRGPRGKPRRARRDDAWGLSL